MSADRVSIFICTYGSDEWRVLANRAEDSIKKQTVAPYEIIKYHGTSLAQSRNTAVRMASGDWGIFCDADDLLTPQYIELMLRASGTLRYPMVGRIYPNGKRELIKYEPCDLTQRNYIVIGAMFRVKDFLAVGGFGDEAIFEDWDLWIRLWKHGVDIKPSEAIYVAHMRENGRNSGNNVDVTYWYNLIRNRYLPKP